MPNTSALPVAVLRKKGTMAVALRQRLAVWMRFLQARRSFVLQAATAGGIAGTSDVLCQKVVEGHERVDVTRACRFAGLISFLIAPISIKWFQFLERAIPGRSLRIAMKRTALDQLIAAPILTSLFLFNINLLETNSIRGSAKRATDLIAPVLSTNYKVWPAIQMINLSLVPVHFRVIVVQLCGLFWNTYISYMQHDYTPKNGTQTEK